MSVQSITPAIPIPPPPVLPVETKPLDVTTAAVLQYLGGDPDALEHLIAICFRAAKGLWLVGLDGHERETRTWVEDWLLDFLHPFRAISMAALIEAADADTFRYIGRRCKFAIIDELRRRSAERRRTPPCDSLSSVIDPTDEETGTLEDRIGTDRTDAPSSLSMKNSFEECLWCIRQALRVVMAHREEFEALDLLDGLKAFLSHAHLILDRRDYDARVTASIAKLRGVGERAARRYKRWFRQEMKRQRERSAVVKEVLGALHLVPPDYTLSK